MTFNIFGLYRFYAPGIGVWVLCVISVLEPTGRSYGKPAKRVLSPTLVTAECRATMNQNGLNVIGGIILAFENILWLPNLKNMFLPEPDSMLLGESTI